jgi:hypothetical protein
MMIQKISGHEGAVLTRRSGIAASGFKEASEEKA